MTDVCISMKNIMRLDLISLAVSLQNHLDKDMGFSISSPHSKSVYLSLVEDEMHAPFRALTPEHIVISTTEAKSICDYTGLDFLGYLKLCLALVLVQRKALCLNPQIKSEDLFHPPNEHCLYNRNLGINNFALHIEKMVLCNGCKDFYHCLGCDKELAHLQKKIDHWKKNTDHEQRTP